MTLEEAIDKEDYKANLCCQLGDIERSNNNFAGIIEFVCKESYHRQIAEWLYELWTIKQKSEEKYWNNEINWRMVNMATLFTEKKTPNQIVQLAIDNNCVNEVYDLLHNIMMDKVKYLKDKSSTLSAEKKLIKKFADLDKLEVIKTILENDEE